jgi:hypothetical protein
MIDKIGRAALFAKSHFTTALNSAKELTGKSIYKARGIKNKVVATNAKIKKDYSVIKIAGLKTLLATVRSEGRLLRKNVTWKNTKNFSGKAFWNYPITTGAGIGLGINTVLPKKKKNKKEGY